MRGADRPPTAPSGATGVARRPAAFTREEASLDEVLLAEHSRLLADRDDLNLVAERTTISVRRSTWSVGSDASEEDAALLRGAAPNRESAARIGAALVRPVVRLDRLAVTRPDARLRNRSAELESPEQRRSIDEIVTEIKTVKLQRERVTASPVDAGGVDPQHALEWLSSLPKLWNETSDAGRRGLAVTTFARLGVVGTAVRGSHRVVSVEASEDAERQGLVLALAASIEVTLVGDTGFEPVTSRM
jgi:hypothetical protein